jgi:hypothetical protein
MTMAKGTFTVTSWDEETYHMLERGAKLTRASVTQTFNGDVRGEGAVVWLMCYHPGGTARFVGLQHVAGSKGERNGGFVLETVGDFDGGEARGNWTVVSGSGTGELAGLRGEGHFRAPRGPEASFELDYVM